MKAQDLLVWGRKEQPDIRTGHGAAARHTLEETCSAHCQELSARTHAQHEQNEVTWHSHVWLPVPGVAKVPGLPSATVMAMEVVLA